MAFMQGPEDRNPTDVEGVLDKFPDLRENYEAGDEATRRFVDDMLQIGLVMNKFGDMVDAGEMWHNTAFEFSAEEMVMSAIHAVMHHGHSALVEFTKLVIMAFEVGHEVGKTAPVTECKCGGGGNDETTLAGIINLN